MEEREREEPHRTQNLNLKNIGYYREKRQNMSDGEDKNKGKLVIN